MLNINKSNNKNTSNIREVKNATWIIGGRIAQMLLSFVVSVITVRYLGPQNHGLISYGAAYVAFFTSLCTLGINSVIIKNFVDYPEEQGVTIGSSIFMRFISSLLSAILIVCIVNILDYDEPLTKAVVSLCSISLVFSVFDTFNYWFQWQYNSKVSSIATLIAYIVSSLYRLILIKLEKDVQWFALTTSLDNILIAMFLFVVYRKNSGPNLKISLNKSKQLIKSSYHYIFSGMMVAIYMQTDKLMLKHMLDETSVSYYSLAASISNLWTFVLVAIIDSIYPTILRLYKTDEDAFNKKNRQLYAIVIYISVFVSLILVLFGDKVISILYGEAYIEAVAPLQIITWYTTFAYLGVARNAWIICKNKQKYLKYMYLCAAIINVVLNYIFIPIIGVTGAALASLITQIFTSMVLPYLWKEMRPNVMLMLDAFFLRKVF